MAIPDEVRRSALAEASAYCERRLPGFARDQVRLEASLLGDAVTIWELRAPWRAEYGPEWSRRKIAQLRHGDGVWSLWWADRNGRWLAYPAPGQVSVARAVALIEADRSGAFFG